MKTLLPLAALLAATACTTIGEPTAADRAALAQELGDRVAVGEPTICVPQRNLQGNRSASERFLLFQGNGDTLYVNEVRGACPILTSSRTLITRTTNSQLCRGDIVEVRDLVSNVSYGSCGLGTFTRYDRR